MRTERRARRRPSSGYRQPHTNRPRRPPTKDSFAVQCTEKSKCGQQGEEEHQHERPGFGRVEDHVRRQGHTGRADQCGSSANRPQSKQERERYRSRPRDQRQESYRLNRIAQESLRCPGQYEIQRRRSLLVALDQSKDSRQAVPGDDEIRGDLVSKEGVVERRQTQ